VIWTPDKDLGQCVRDHRVVQYDRGREASSTPKACGPNSEWCRSPSRTGWPSSATPPTASRYRRLGQAVRGDCPRGVRASRVHPARRRRMGATASPARPRPGAGGTAGVDLELAVLFRVLATLQIEPSLLATVDELAWAGPRPGFAELARYLGTRQWPSAQRRSTPHEIALSAANQNGTSGAHPPGRRRRQPARDDRPPRSAGVFCRPPPAALAGDTSAGGTPDSTR